MDTPSSPSDEHAPAQPKRKGPTRRQLLLGGAIGGLGAAAAVGTDVVLSARHDAAQATQDAAWTNGPKTVPFFAAHQAGVEGAPQSHQNLVALSLRPEVTRDDVERLLRVLTDDAARLAAGNYALADSEPELALIPANLTVTFGFGRGLVELVSPGAAPDWLAPLPAFSHERLREEWSGGDLLLQVASDDQFTVAHATRMLLKDARGFTTVKWTQPGFRRAYGSERPGRTQRNLLGQIDGTVNPVPGSEDFAGVVWSGGGNPAWLENGTGLVIRRIDMLLDKWDKLDRSGREQAVGRRLSSGAPLTGNVEADEPDFEARTPLGFPVIAEFAHIRRARSDDTHQRMFRRSYNYDEHPYLVSDYPSDTGITRSGLIFGAFVNNVSTQFVPVQQRLDELDLLNEWIMPVGSAVFAIPPGCAEDGFIGETLFA